MTAALEGPPQRKGSVELLELLSPTRQRSRVLGSGAHGLVKSVKLNADQGLVAVKTLRTNATAAEVQCFTREKEILRKLEHECADYASLCLQSLRPCTAVSVQADLVC